MPDKNRERHYLTQLRRCIRLPPGEPIEAEPPDFLLGETPERVGIEFTEYHHPAEKGRRPFQEVQSLKKQIVERAERIHTDSGGPALYLTAIFARHVRLTKGAAPRIAEHLADAVLAVRVPSSVREPHVEIPRNLLPPEVAKAWAHGSVDGVDRLWKADHIGWVASITPEHVQAELARKQRVVRAARQHCDLLWLVIVHNLTRGAPCELSNESAGVGYLSDFDRVLWLDPHGPRARDLRVSAV